MTREEIRATVDSLRRLVEFTTDTGLAITVERSLWLLREMAKLRDRPAHIIGGVVVTKEEIQAWNAAIGRGARPLRKRDWVCCCGKELDGSHDHNSCGPPEPRSGDEIVTIEEIQADAETQVIPREVADRLAEALEASLAVLKHPDPSGHPALAEYRKAVSGG